MKKLKKIIDESFVTDYGNAAGGNSSYYISNSNPAFQIKIGGLNNTFTATQGYNPDNKPENLNQVFKIGDIISGHKLGDKKTYKGSITGIDEENHNITILDKNKKSIKLDSSTCVPVSKKDYDEQNSLYMTENKILNFGEYIKLNENNGK